MNKKATHPVALVKTQSGKQKTWWVIQTGKISASGHADAGAEGQTQLGICL